MKYMYRLRGALRPGGLAHGHGALGHLASLWVNSRDHL